MEPHVVLAVEESQRAEHIRQAASSGRTGTADQAEEVLEQGHRDRRPHPLYIQEHAAWKE